MWERQALKTDGYLKKDSARGIWEITDEGKKLYQTLKRK
jgi:predicted transcriptional regulator